METENKEKDWNGVELWLAELIEQKKTDAKRWFIAFIITMAALICTNAYWIHVFQSYDYVTQDSSGLNNFNKGTQGNVLNESENTVKEEE